MTVSKCIETVSRKHSVRGAIVEFLREYMEAFNERMVFYRTSKMYWSFIAFDEMSLRHTSREMGSFVRCSLLVLSRGEHEMVVSDTE